jgi:kynurenine formamidase
MSGASVLGAFADLLMNGGIKVVDLTQPLEPTTPILSLPPEFAQNPPFEIEVLSEYDSRGPMWYWNWFKCGEHTGTHFDAPIHWISGKDFEGNSTDTIPPERFIGPACVINVAEMATKDPDHLVTIDQILAWEKINGRIPAGAWVLIRSDWSKRTDPKEFLNVHEDGAHTPGWHSEAVPFLAKERDVRGVGVETVGTDAGQAFRFNPAFPCHALMHGSNKFGLASLTNLDKLPPTGAIIIAAPLKIVRGSGSPLRVLALVPA